MNTQSSNGCECPTEKGLQWHTYECTFADKPSPEEWEADYYEGGMGAIVSRKRNELASYKEIRELIERVRTADRERVREEAFKAGWIAGRNNLISEEAKPMDTTE